MWNGTKCSQDEQEKSLVKLDVDFQADCLVKEKRFEQQKKEYLKMLQELKKSHLNFTEEKEIECNMQKRDVEAGIFSTTSDFAVPIKNNRSSKFDGNPYTYRFDVSPRDTRITSREVRIHLWIRYWTAVNYRNWSCKHSSANLLIGLIGPVCSLPQYTSVFSQTLRRWVISSLSWLANPEQQCLKCICNVDDKDGDWPDLLMPLFVPMYICWRN